MCSVKIIKIGVWPFLKKRCCRLVNVYFVMEFCKFTIRGHQFNGHFTSELASFGQSSIDFQCWIFVWGVCVDVCRASLDMWLTSRQPPLYLLPAVRPIVSIQQFTDATLAEINNWGQLDERGYATTAICYQMGANLQKWTSPNLVHLDGGSESVPRSILAINIRLWESICCLHL